jgi:hypothetical protein
MFLFAFIILAFGSTPKEQCQYIRLDETERSIREEKEYNYPSRLKTMKDVPVYSQKFGICYASTAAHIFDALQHLSGGDKNESMSPLSLAVLFHEEAIRTGKFKERKTSNGPLKYVFEGGGLCEAFEEQALTEGACSIKDIEHSNYKSRLSHSQLEDLGKLFDNYEMDDSVDEVKGSVKLPIKKRDVASKRRDKVVESTLHNKCKLIKANFKAKCEKKYPETEEVTLTKLHAHLNQNDPVIPLGVSFCHAFLTDFGGKYSGFVRAQQGSPGKMKLIRLYEKDCVKHTALLTGRRWNEKTNTCQFLIRNSLGPNCSIYLNEFKKDCDQGNLWINEDILKRNIYKFYEVRLQ